ncbi:hypothetical protein HYQ44_005342 [Verticillium longisporum]|nr:hypothetical protein HYQ44_005342 [Verticillium longisporum]
MHLFAHHMPAALVLSPDSWEDVRRRQVLARRQQGNERKLVTIIILACLMGLILLTLERIIWRSRCCTARWNAPARQQQREREDGLTV